MFKDYEIYEYRDGDKKEFLYLYHNPTQDGTCIHLDTSWGDSFIGEVYSWDIDYMVKPLDGITQPYRSFNKVDGDFTIEIPDDSKAKFFDHNGSLVIRNNNSFTYGNTKKHLIICSHGFETKKLNEDHLAPITKLRIKR